MYSNLERPDEKQAKRFHLLIFYVLSRKHWSTRETTTNKRNDENADERCDSSLNQKLQSVFLIRRMIALKMSMMDSLSFAIAACEVNEPYKDAF